MRLAVLVVSCAAAVLAGILEVFLVPLRTGTALAPIAVLLALAGNVLFPRLARTAYDAAAAAVAPVLSWLVAVCVLAMLPRPEGDVLVRGDSGEQWVFYGLLFGGVIVGCLSVVLTGPRSQLGS